LAALGTVLREKCAAKDYLWKASFTPNGDVRYPQSSETEKQSRKRDWREERRGEEIKNKKWER